MDECDPLVPNAANECGKSLENQLKYCVLCHTSLATFSYLYEYSMCEAGR